LAAGAICTQRYVSGWDEVGKLVTAQRLDGEEGIEPLGAGLSLAHDSTGQRTRKTPRDAQGTERHAACIFPSLEVWDAAWREGDGDDERTVKSERVLLGSVGVGVAPALAKGSLRNRWLRAHRARIGRIRWKHKEPRVICGSWRAEEESTRVFGAAVGKRLRTNAERGGSESSIGSRAAGCRRGAPLVVTVIPSPKRGATRWI
jgi:hypothetical protein